MLLKLKAANDFKKNAWLFTEQKDTMLYAQ
jgi:hypothetical protein